MTDAGRVRRAMPKGWEVIWSDTECACRTEPTSSSCSGNRSRQPEDLDRETRPVPYELTLLGAVEVAMWNVEKDTPPDVWMDALPRLRAMLVEKFGETIAHEVLD